MKFGRRTIITTLLLMIAATLLCSAAYFTAKKYDLETAKKVFALEHEKEEGHTYPPIIVDDFDKGATSGVFFERKNSIGGYQGTWSRRPSYSLISKSETERRGAMGSGLAIEWKKEGGWCGWYTLLNGLDVSAYNCLSFWVKGERGREKFDIGIADSEMVDLGIDARYFGSIDSFLPRGVTTEWQEARIPLSRVASEIDLSKAGSLVINFPLGGSGKIYLEDIVIKDDPKIAEVEEYNLPQAKIDRAHPRSMWVWKTDPVNNRKAQEAILRFCERAAISKLYIYFGELSDEKEYRRHLSRFLELAHKKNIKVEALTGNPAWILPENHNLTLNWIKAFLEYNKQVPEKARFDGVSLDLEPYLLAEWEKDKEPVKKQYLEILEKCRQLIDPYKQKFSFGVAIPVFLDKEDSGDLERKVLKIVDYVALMDYYDDANSLIKNAKEHLSLAKEAGKKVAIGLETQDLVTMHQGSRRNTFFEEGWKAMEKELSKLTNEFGTDKAFEGYAIHCFESYKLLQRGRNAPVKERPVVVYKLSSSIKGSQEAEPLVLDAKENVTYGVGAWKGKDDYSVAVYSQWDEQNLYFTFKVTDDKSVQQWTGENMWQGDHIELWLDADLMGDYNEAMNSEDDFQIGLSPGNFSNIPPEVYIWTPNIQINYRDILEVKSSKTAGGYIIEAKIPKEVLFANLAEVEKEEHRDVSSLPAKFESGMKFGISVDASDTDDPSKPQKALMSSSKDRIWGDPTTFGILELK